MLRWEQMTVGDRLGPLHWVVSPVVADGFLHACRTPRDVCALLRSDGVAHPTLTVSDYVRMLTIRYAPVGSGLHARQETALHRPIPIGTSLEVTAEIVALYERNDRDYWTMEYRVADSSDRSGAPFVTHTMTCSIDRPVQVQPAPAGGDAVAGAGSVAVDAASTVVDDVARRWQPIELVNQIDFGAQYVLRFGEQFDPRRNAHTDPDYAREVGLADTVGYSGLHYAWFAEAALRHFGPRWLTGGSLSAKFVGAVFPGDEVGVGVVGPHGASASAVRLDARLRDGTVVAVGSAGVA